MPTALARGTRIWVTNTETDESGFSRGKIKAPVGYVTLATPDGMQKCVALSGDPTFEDVISAISAENEKLKEDKEKQPTAAPNEDILKERDEHKKLQAAHLAHQSEITNLRKERDEMESERNSLKAKLENLEQETRPPAPTGSPSAELQAKFKELEEAHNNLLAEHNNLKNKHESAKQERSTSGAQVGQPPDQTALRFDFMLPYTQDWQAQFVQKAEEEALKEGLTGKDWSLSNFVVIGQDESRLQTEANEPSQNQFPLRVEYRQG